MQIQAKVQTRAQVSVCCAGLTAEQLATAHLGFVPDVGAFIGDALARAGSGARLCVLPEGPQTIPYLRT